MGGIIMDGGLAGELSLSRAVIGGPYIGRNIQAELLGLSPLAVDASGFWIIDFRRTRSFMSFAGLATHFKAGRTPFIVSVVSRSCVFYHPGVGFGSAIFICTVDIDAVVLQQHFPSPVWTRKSSAMAACGNAPPASHEYRVCCRYCV